MLTLDNRNWLGRVAGFRRRRVQARESSLRTLVGMAVRHVVRVAPRDTGRYVRGWALAGRGAGADVQVPPLTPSRDAKWRRDRLVAQFVGLREKTDRWYGTGAAEAGTPTNGRKSDKWFRRLIKAYRRAREELEKYTETSVFMFGRGSAKTLIARLDTVRSKVYGGAGRIVSTQDRSVAELKNLEPHASIVEARSRTLGGALRVVRSFGVRKVGRDYLRAVDAGRVLRVRRAA